MFSQRYKKAPITNQQFPPHFTDLGRQGLFVTRFSQTLEAHGCASRASWMDSCVFAKSV